MQNYRFITDSTADLSSELIKELELYVIPLKFRVDEKEYDDIPDSKDMTPEKFYNMLRNGSRCSTSQITPAEFVKYFEPILKNGEDIFYLAFSSALSGTYQSACIARDELKEKYNDRKIVVVDSRAACQGEGLFAYITALKKREGVDIEELEKWALEKRDHICHWFTVDDLFFLKRGGRVSAASAVVGSALGIKPILHVDDEGRLIPVKNVRGRKKALDELVEVMKKTSIDPETQTIFISHGDCLKDAEYVADKIKTIFGIKRIIINYNGPVIGSHSGPGTVALFFIGTEK